MDLAFAMNLVTDASAQLQESDVAKKSIAERIAQLEAQKKSLQARLAKQERTKDTRRKVLLGAFLLHRLESDRDFGPTLQGWLRRELPGFLVRPDDKALFADLLAASAHERSAPPPAATRETAPAIPPATPVEARESERLT